MARVSGEYQEREGGPSHNLWSGAVLGHGACWTLVTGKDAGGSVWQLVTPYARRTVVDFEIKKWIMNIHA